MFKKPILLVGINPRTIFTIIIILTVAWILSKPLKVVGESTYSFLGSRTNYIFHLISNTKEKIQELITTSNSRKEQIKNISFLKMKVNLLESELKEVNSLKNLLKLQKEINYKTVACNLIGRTPDNWHKQIIINKGGNYKIMVGDSVLTYKGIVGQIVEVSENTSIVQLVSDPSYRVGCKVLRNNILGILSGKTNDIGLLEFIPVDSKIMTGDIVVTSGLQSKDLLPAYPKAHPIGKVIKVSKKKKKASDLYIEVKLFEDLTTLSNVIVFSPGWDHQ